MDRSTLSSELQTRIDRVYTNLIGKDCSAAADRVFDIMDTNNDGVVDRNEWEAHMHPRPETPASGRSPGPSSPKSVVLTPGSQRASPSSDRSPDELLHKIREIRTQAQLQNHRESHFELKAQIQELKNASAAREQLHANEIQDRSSQLKELSHALATEKQRRSEAERKRLEALEEAEDQQTTERQAEQLREELRKSQSQLRDSIRACEAREQEVARLKRAVNTAQSEAERLGSANEGNNAMIQELTASVSEAQITISTLQRQIHQLSNSSEHAARSEARAKQLEAELCNIQNSFKNELAEKDAKLAQLEVRLLASTWEMSEKDSGLSEQQKETKQKEQMVARLARELADTRTQAQQKEAEWDSAKQQVMLVVDELETELNTVKAQLAEAQIQVQALLMSPKEPTAARGTAAKELPASPAPRSHGEGMVRRGAGLRDLFELADRNGDGVIDRDEFRRLGPLMLPGRQPESSPASLGVSNPATLAVSQPLVGTGSPSFSTLYVDPNSGRAY